MAVFDLEKDNKFPLHVNRVKAFPLKKDKVGMLVERLYMQKLKNAPSAEYSINYNYVIKEIEKLENKNNDFDEKLFLNELKYKIRNCSNFELGAFSLQVLSEVFMSIIKLNTQKNAF